MADGPFPFLLGPCKERFSGFFSFCEFYFSFPAFLSHEVCLSGCAHGSVTREQHLALGQGNANVLSCPIWGEIFSNLCYMLLLSFSLN